MRGANDFFTRRLGSLGKHSRIALLRETFLGVGVAVPPAPAPPAPGVAPGLVFGDSFGVGEEVEAGGVVVVPVPPGPPGEGLELPGLVASLPQAPRATAKPTAKVKRINPLFIKTP